MKEIRTTPEFNHGDFHKIFGEQCLKIAPVNNQPEKNTERKISIAITTPIKHDSIILPSILIRYYPVWIWIFASTIAIITMLVISAFIFAAKLKKFAEEAKNLAKKLFSFSD
ncbi:hypothetical protein RF11_15772 [Thelohanellus kitauei]|uniref:Uncharacterized protein n=1 Tax=Thelohanellus kitauei TaxID=669202 RepID=A0A0C2JQV0_THEKT|nr:hypothetical protein RF11_15772 [Thelohanellus kitauei]